MAVADSSAGIVVKRARSLAGILWHWSVTVDGREVGALANGETIRVDLAAGRHVIQVGPASVVRGLKSRPLELAINEGEQVQLVCEQAYWQPRPRLVRAGGDSHRAVVDRSDFPALRDGANTGMDATSPPSPQVIEVSRDEVHTGDETLLIDNSQSASQAVANW